MQLHKWFIPHRDTHQKAHLISWQAIFVYIVLFGILQLSFKFISTTKPGILGIASNVNQQKIIELTNSERLKLGLPAVSENSALDQAAAAKAKNMFEENYWAHYSPSGKDPWGFISGAGYKFSVAGENLAKNFQNSDDVVAAWMASPSHKENIVNSKYKEIGIAVVNGMLNGEETTLVVQMFGSPPPGFAVAQVPTQAEQPTTVSEPADVDATSLPLSTPQPTQVTTRETPTSFVASTQTANIQPLANPFRISQTVALSIVSLIFILLLVDIYILRRRGVLRITSNHFAHMSILAVAAGVIITASPGEITTSAASLEINFLWTLP